MTAGSFVIVLRYSVARLSMFKDLLFHPEGVVLFFPPAGRKKDFTLSLQQ